MTETKSSNPEQACINCHFLRLKVFDMSSLNDDDSHDFIDVEADSDYRKRIKAKDYSFVADINNAQIMEGLICFEECWKEKKLSIDEFESIVIEDQTDCADFFKYKPGIDPDAAIRRRNKKREDEKRALLQLNHNKGISQGTETVAYNWKIDKNKRGVYCNELYIVKLPNLQFKLFERLYKKAGKDVKNATLEQCWGNKKPDYVSYLSTEMSRIGSKLKKGLEENNIKIDGKVIKSKKEHNKNVSYKLVIQSSITYQ